MARFEGDRLLVATHNAGKLEEMAALLAPFGVTVVGAAELGLPEPAETESTFVGNARIKAHAAAKATGLPALADDSGIEVDALDGAPTTLDTLAQRTGLTLEALSAKLLALELDGRIAPLPGGRYQKIH